MLPEKVDAEFERALRIILAIRPATLPRESVVCFGILVDRHQRVATETPFEHGVDLGLHPAILHRHVEHERAVEVLRLDDVVLDVSVKEEACPFDLAPTSSTTATLAFGDALAIALLDKRKFTPEEFAMYHPAHDKHSVG